MPSVTTLLVFATIAIGFAAVPGPSNLFVLSRGIGVGVRTAIAGAAGCATGAAVYVLGTAIGLVAVIASSRTVFLALHYAGAAYLIVLGVRAMRSRGALDLDLRGGAPQLAGAYRQGVLVELSNPKVALFFLALFPQFVQSGHGAAWSQIMVLGALFVTIGFLSDSMYAFGSGAIGRRLARRSAIGRRRHQLTGALYLGLAAWALASGASSSRTAR
jgi:threonine/homoserine/homoserine lactone efflux protein